MNLPPLFRPVYGRCGGGDVNTISEPTGSGTTVVTQNNNTRTKCGKQQNLKALTISLSMSLSPVGPARRSLPSALQPSCSESPDAQPSSPCWGPARPPIRISCNLWPYERLRVKSLSIQNLQQNTKFCCTYCSGQTRTAVTSTLQVISAISELTLRTKSR